MYNNKYIYRATKKFLAHEDILTEGKQEKKYVYSTSSWVQNKRHWIEKDELIVEHPIPVHGRFLFMKDGYVEKCVFEEYVQIVGKKKICEYCLLKDCNCQIV